VLQKITLLAIAGGAGTLARYGLAGVVQRYLGESFPWGTAVVNVLGCFLFGIIWATSIERGELSSEMRTVLLVGFMGSFTTFSTFASETGRLLADSEILLAFGNVVFQVIAGIGILFLGIALGRTI
jgi:CrcB protein